MTNLDRLAFICCDTCKQPIKPGENIIRGPGIRHYPKCATLEPLPEGVWATPPSQEAPNVESEVMRSGTPLPIGVLNPAATASCPKSPNGWHVWKFWAAASSGEPQLPRCEECDEMHTLLDSVGVPRTEPYAPGKENFISLERRVKWLVDKFTAQPEAQIEAIREAVKALVLGPNDWQDAELDAILHKAPHGFPSGPGARNRRKVTRYKRECEICGHRWKSKNHYGWILVCPKCKVSGYHLPRAGRGESPEAK